MKTRNRLAGAVWSSWSRSPKAVLDDLTIADIALNRDALLARLDGPPPADQAASVPQAAGAQ